MYLVHRLLHQATGVSRCCWARVASGEEELVVVRGRGFEVYGVVASTLQLRCAFSFEQRIHDLAPCRRPRGPRDALVLSFGVFKVALVDVDGDGELRDLALFDLEPGAAGLGAAPLADVETKPFGSAATDRTPPALAVARDGSSAAALVEGRLVIIPLLCCPDAETGEPPKPWIAERAAKRGELPRFFDYAPGAGPATLIVVLGDARGDVPKSTRVAALGVDVAGRRVYPLWSVDGLPPVAQCLACTRDGGSVVVFRNSLAKIARGGAYEALALNGFADLDFSAESAGRHLLRANDEKLAVAVGGECAAAELVDDVVLLSLPGASTCWVLDGRRGRLHLRPLAAAPVASCVAYDPRRRRVFLGSFDGDGVLGDVGLAAAPNRRLNKKPKLDEGFADASDELPEGVTREQADAEWRALYGAARGGFGADAAPPPLRLTATDSLLGVGAVVDATWSARTTHRWPFQPQRNADVKKTAAEAAAAGRAELVACCGASSGARGSLATLGGGAAVRALATFAVDGVAKLFRFGWRGPFRGEETKSREVSTRDVVVAATSSGARWFLFDGTTFQEQALEFDESDDLVGVVAPPVADADSFVFLVFAQGGFVATKDAASVRAGSLAADGLAAVASHEARHVALTANGDAFVVDVDGDKLSLGDQVFDDEVEAVTVARCPGSLLAPVEAMDVDDAAPAPGRWHAATKFDERAYLYGADLEDAKPVKKEVDASFVFCVGILGDGALASRRVDGDGPCRRWPGATLGPPRLLAGARLDADDEGVPPPRCVAVALQRVGPVLAVETVGKWCLALALETGDALVYWSDGATPGLRKLEHDFIGRPRAGVDAAAVSLSPFGNVESRSGVFLGLAKPAALLCERGLPTIVRFDAFGGDEPAAATSGACFAPLPSIRGFLVCCKGDGDRWAARVCGGLGNVVLAGTSPSSRLVIHKSPLEGAAPLRVCSLGPPPPGVDAAPAYALLCARPRDDGYVEGEVLDEDAEPSTEAPNGCKAWPLECLHDGRLGGVPPPAASNKGEVRLVTGLGFSTLQRVILRRGERGVSLSIGYFMKKAERARVCYVICGTVHESGIGEDGPTRGRILLLEVEYRAVRRKPPKDNPDNRRGRRCGYLPVLKVAYEKEVKGCVSCVRQLQDHVLCAVSNRVEVYLLDPSGKLLQIAMLHGQVHIVSLKVVKNFVLYADVYQSAHLLYWRDRDRMLMELAKDGDHALSSVAAADFVVDAGELPGTHALGIVLGDGDALRLLQYAPLGSARDRGGKKLLSRSHFALASPVSVMLRHRVGDVGDALGPARVAAVYGSRDGAVGGAFPVDERAFRRLGALAAVLANALRHNAALHPDKNLLASTHARNVLDGDLLFRYVALDHQLQVDLAKAVGTTKDTILDTLLAVDDLANFL